MAFCGNCGFQNPDGARFCGSCGADLSQQEIGNVESIVNESAGSATPDNNPMDYVPLQASEPTEAFPPSESVGTYPPSEPAEAFPPSEPAEAFPPSEPVMPPVTPPTPQPTAPPVTPPTPQPAAPPVTPPTPQPAAPPVTPPTPQPAAPPVVSPAAPAPPAAPQQVVVQPSGPVQPTRPVPPKSSGGSAGKTCLGCGCAAVIVTLLVIGGLCWWFYSYYKQHDKDIEEVLEWVDKSHDKWEEENGVGNEDPETQTYNGMTLKLLAEEQGFPSVTYSELPKEGAAYFNDEDELALRFNKLKFKEGNYIGVITISNRSTGEVAMFRISPCGCSIYHLNYPSDESISGYIFVYKAARRILINGDGEIKEFVLPEVDDDADDEEVYEEVADEVDD